ncbi:uncharacterized protein [Miscanthus floridulus]|uniref:uncharacterized protein n=1 Tax=Miscanthus floridulus TaxID=154761 RepID=UPI00345B1358
MGAPVPMTAETAVSAAGASASAEAITTEAGAPESAEAVIVEARAPEVTTAVVTVARPSVQEAEMSAAEASAVPLAQGPLLLRESARETEVYLISSDDTSRAREVVGAEEADVVEQPAPLLDEGSSALVRLGSEASRVAEASRVEAQRLKEKAEACQAKTRRRELKAKESEAEIIRAAKASSAV